MNGSVKIHTVQMEHIIEHRTQLLKLGKGLHNELNYYFPTSHLLKTLSPQNLKCFFPVKKRVYNIFSTVPNLFQKLILCIKIKKWVELVAVYSERFKYSFH